jgi:PST family polysaccharide transporter
MSPITQGLYPHMSAKFNSSKEIAIKFLRKSLYPITGLGIAISLLLLIFAEPMVVFALGRSFTNSIIILKIISFLPFIILLSNIFGVQILLNLNGSKEFSMIVLSAGIFNLCLSLILVPKLLAAGTAISVMVTEIIVTSLTAYYAKIKLKASDGV